MTVDGFILGNWYSVVLEKFGIQVISRGDPLGFLVKIESKLEQETILETIQRHSQVLADTIFT